MLQTHVSQTGHCTISSVPLCILRITADRDTEIRFAPSGLRCGGGEIYISRFPVRFSQTVASIKGKICRACADVLFVRLEAERGEAIAQGHSAGRGSVKGAPPSRELECNGSLSPCPAPGVNRLLLRDVHIKI